MLTDRRELGRRVAEVRSERRRLLGAPAILAELEQLDEAALGRRRLASEQRRWTRLVDELDALPEPSEELR